MWGFIIGTITLVIAAICSVASLYVGPSTSFGVWLMTFRFIFGSISFWSTGAAYLVDVV